MFLVLDASDAHRHHDVLEVRVLGNRDQRAGIGVAEAHLQVVDLQVREHVDQIRDVEADLDAVAP